MIIVTGGAGFIGSAVVWALNRRGEEDIHVVDSLGKSEKWRNLAGLQFRDYEEKDTFLESLWGGRFPKGDVRAIIHMGACSDTTETDASYLVRNNYQYTRSVAEYAVSAGVRFIYASSAATYGDGSAGFEDDEETLDRLRPLNMYAYSKQMFDLWARRHGLLGSMAGLKYFNVFGPNEYHKGEMRSMIAKGWEQIRRTGAIRLFKSHRPPYGHGEQQRDFIYVKDAVRMTLHVLDHPEVNGLFNIGSGSPVAWNQLARALFEALGREPNIEYIDMPQELRAKYQDYTSADMTKFRETADAPPPDEEAFRRGVIDYVRNYLEPGRHLGDPPDEEPAE